MHLANGHHYYHWVLRIRKFYAMLCCFIAHFCFSFSLSFSQCLSLYPLHGLWTKSWRLQLERSDSSMHSISQLKLQIFAVEQKPCLSETTNFLLPFAACLHSHFVFYCRSWSCAYVTQCKLRQWVGWLECTIPTTNIGLNKNANSLLIWISCWPPWIIKKNLSPNVNTWTIVVWMARIRQFSATEEGADFLPLKDCIFFASFSFVVCVSESHGRMSWLWEQTSDVLHLTLAH